MGARPVSANREPPDREHLELRVASEPVRRRPESQRPWAWLAYGLLGVAWIVGFLLLALLVARLTAAPSSAPDPTTPAAARDLSGRPEDASGPRPSGAPRSTVVSPGSVLDEHPGRPTVGAPQTLDPRIGREGDIAHTGSRTPYLAIPLGPGVRIRICGPAACLEATSTDAGPDRSMLLAGRIADLDITRFETVCGVPARFGLCPGSWVVLKRAPDPTLPPTDTGG